MKPPFHQSPAKLFLVASILGFACANRGMEAPDDLLSEGGISGATGGQSGGAGAPGTGGLHVGTGGAATGGSAGHGSGGAAGSPSTGGAAGGVAGRPGTGGTPVGTGGVGTGGRPATGGVAGSSMAGTGGVAGAAGRPATGGAGGAAGAAGQTGTGGLQQLTVSIDFIGGRTATGGSGVVDAPAMAATETAGVKPAANWNGAADAAGTLTGLRASDGSPTTAAVVWNSPAVAGNPGVWTNTFADAPGNVRMMNGYLDPTAAASPATVKVSSLPATIAGGYDVYVYVYGDIPDSSTRTSQYAIGSTSFALSQTGPATTFSAFTRAPPGGSGNYILFRNVSGASFTLTATPGTGPQTRAPINGLQIVWPSGS